MAQARYDGLPHIRLYGDKEKALTYVGLGKSLLYKVQTITSNAEVNTFALQEALPDGDGFIHALSANGVCTITISVDPNVKEKSVVPVLEFYPPVLLSGWVQPGTYQFDEAYYQELRQKKVSELQSQTPPQEYTSSIDQEVREQSELLSSYNCTLEDPEHVPQSVFRLVAKTTQKVPFFKVEGDFTIPGAYTGPTEQGMHYSQHNTLFPSMYGGDMEYIVRVLFGLGTTNVKALRSIPAWAQRGGGVDTAKTRGRLPSARYVATIEQYGWRVGYSPAYSRTHQCMFDTQGIPWLLEFSSTRGLLAMQLPIFIGSDMQQFLDYCEANKAWHLKEVAEYFKGVPTGEGFPTGLALDEAIEAGRVFRLLTAEQIGAFYSGASPLFDNCGWTSYPMGREFHNTCKTYENGLPYSAWWQINVVLDETGKRAEINRQRKGCMYRPLRRVQRQPYNDLPLKVPAGYGSSVISVDGGALDGTVIPANIVCDAPMYVCFVGTTLHLVSYYYNSRPHTVAKYETDKPESCVFGGEWTTTEISGTTESAPIMYTNLVDVRRPLVPSTRVTVERSTPSHWSVAAGDFIPEVEYGFMFRQKTFVHRTTTTYGGYDALATNIVIPTKTRAGYVAGWYSNPDEQTRTDISHMYTYLHDGHVYYTFRCFVRILGNPLPLECVSPRSICGHRCNYMMGGAHKDPQRKVVCHTYGAVCGGMVDEGEWLSKCEDVDSYFNNPAPPSPPLPANIQGERKPTTPVCKGRAVLPNARAEIYNLSPESYWYTWDMPSPTPDGAMPSFSAVHVTTGAINFARYTRDYDAGPTSDGKLHAETETTGRFPCFIGVPDNG